MADAIPDYIEERIRRPPPVGIPIVPGSTPVVAFGDVRRARIATLGWNPSSKEFLDKGGKLLTGEKQRLETLKSIGTSELAKALTDVIRRVFVGCNDYFLGCPYIWFDKLEKVLTDLGASYYDGSACHLDFVQWATDPAWGKLSKLHQSRLIAADVPFFRKQLSQEKINVLLLNGMGIVDAVQGELKLKLSEVPSLSKDRTKDRIRLYRGVGFRGLKIVGWNINLQTTPGVSNIEIKFIGDSVKYISESLF